MTYEKREPDGLAAKNVNYSPLETFENTSANARAFAGRAERGAVTIEAANPITAAPVSYLAPGPATLPSRRCRIRSSTSSMSGAANGCRPDTIPYRTTHRDQTSSASFCDCHCVGAVVYGIGFTGHRVDARPVGVPPRTRRKRRSDPLEAGFRVVKNSQGVRTDFRIKC